MASLYQRLGGLEAITSVVDSFVARCAGDDRINRKFERSDSYAATHLSPWTVQVQPGSSGRSRERG